jgi:hypothetical protein
MGSSAVVFSMKSTPVEASPLLKAEVVQVLARVSHMWLSERLVLSSSSCASSECDVLVPVPSVCVSVQFQCGLDCAQAALQVSLRFQCNAPFPSFLFLAILAAFCSILMELAEFPSYGRRYLDQIFGMYCWASRQCTWLQRASLC